MAVVVMRFAGHCVAAACVAAPFCAPRRRPCRGGQPLLSFLGKILRRQARHAGHVHDDGSGFEGRGRRLQRTRKASLKNTCVAEFRRTATPT
jgi:hypothetical protein